MPQPWELNWDTPQAPKAQAPPRERPPWELNWEVPAQEYKREAVPSALPEDPAERAALRMRRQVSTPRDPRSPLAQLPTTVGRATESMGKTAHDLLTGELEPTPENVLPAATAVISPALRGAQMGARAAVESTLPRFTQGGLRQTAAEQLAGIPGVGAPIRRAADEAQEALAGRIIAAPTRPTGAPPNLGAAGDILTGAAQAEQKALKAAQPTALEWEEVAARLPPGIRDVLKGFPENAPGRLVGMAGTGASADLRALGALKTQVPAEAWPQVQGAFLHQLGLRPAAQVGQAATFDPMLMLNRYANELSAGGRGLIFGSPNKAPLRQHLDSLVADTKRLDATLGGIPTGTTLKGWAMLGGIGYPLEPTTALATLVGGRMLASWLSRPAPAASLSAWSKAYTRFMMEGGPAAASAFATATRNLANTTGTPIDPDKLVEAIRQGRPEPARPQRAGAGPSGFDPRGFDQIAPIIQQTMRMAPRGIGVEGMRRSTNVEYRPEPNEVPVPYWEQSKATEDWLGENWTLPRERLSEEAGLGDLEGPRGKALLESIRRELALADQMTAARSRPRPRRK